MENKVLLVDDVTNVLDSFRRNLRGVVNFDVANSGEKALQLMEKNNYAVLVTDMSMPEMDGLTLLRHVKKRHPDTIRIMLTGNGDLKTAMDAVNVGDVYLFLAKPCSIDMLTSAIESGFRQHDLQMAEKVLLNNTLQGVVGVLSEVLGLVNPMAEARTSQLNSHMTKLAKELKLKYNWSFEPMIALSQLGAIIFPSIIADSDGSATLSHAENELVEQHPSLAFDLLNRIPRMESIAKTILYQEKGYDGSGFPEDDVKGEDIPLGSRMLKVVLDFLKAKEEDKSDLESLKVLEGQKEKYDTKVLAAFRNTLFAQTEAINIPLNQVDIGMVLAQSLKASNGKIVARVGQTVTATIVKVITLCTERGILDGRQVVKVALEESAEAKG